MPTAISQDLLSSSPPPPPQRGSSLHARFPVGLCALQILLTCAGLAAAALGVRWGAAPTPRGGDMLDAAWLYVNILLVAGWMVEWPAAAYSRFRNVDRDEAPPPFAGQLLWDAAALILGAGPALTVAAFTAPTNPRQLEVMLATQAALMIFALGVLTCGYWKDAGRATGRFEGIAAGVLAGLALAGPVAVYFWSEFFPHAPAQWFIGVPMMAVHQAALPGEGVPPVLWVAAGYALLGLILFMIGVKE